MTKQKVCFLIYDDVEVLDFSGPFDVFSMANYAHTAFPDPCREEDAAKEVERESNELFDLFTVAETCQAVTAQHGMRIVPTYSIENCPEEIDILFVPGGLGMECFKNRHPDLINWLEDRGHQKHLLLASVCVGALILAQTSLLDGPLQVTTHHASIGVLRDLLEKRGSKATIIPGARYIDNRCIDGMKLRGVLCSAGVSAGIDLSYHILRNRLRERVCDVDFSTLAWKTADSMEYNQTINWVEEDKYKAK